MIDVKYAHISDWNRESLENKVDYLFWTQMELIKAVNSLLARLPKEKNEKA